MILPVQANKKQAVKPEVKQKNIQELLATILAFIGVFIFFVKILFF